jgi:hypothetical protein
VSSPWDTQIDQDLAWRETELASLKKEVVQASHGSVKRQTLLRALMAMLYAHYEGFFKFCWFLYLDTIQGTGLNRTHFTDCISILSLKKEFRMLKSDTPTSTIWDFVQSKLPALMNSPISFEQNLLELRGESNLYPKNLADYLALINLPNVEVDENASLLKTLVQRRNLIAHGSKFIVENLAQYKKFEDAVFTVMHQLGIAISEALYNQDYLRVPKSACIPITVQSNDSPRQ